MANGRQVATRPSGAASNKQVIEGLRTQLLSRTSDIERALAGTIKPEVFIEVALTAIATLQDPDQRAKILACTADSIVLSVVKAALAGLKIDGKQSTIIPYGQVATWSPMVKGRRDLIMRSENVAKVVSRHVLEGDEFSFRLGTNEEIIHVPSLDPKPDAKVTHAYAIVTYKDGTQVFEVLSRNRIEDIRTKMSKAGSSPAWKNSYPQMAEKCALNRLEQMVDTDTLTSSRMAHAMDAEFDVGAALPVDPGATAADRVNDQVDEAKRRLMELKAQRDGEASDPEPQEEPARADGGAMVKLEDLLNRALNAGISVENERGMKAALESGDAERVAKWTVWAEAKLAQPKDQGPIEGGEPEGPAPDIKKPAADLTSKINPLECRQTKDKVAHVIDPTVPSTKTNPPKCIGCGVEVGGAAGAKFFAPSSDATIYCPKALRKIDDEYSAERVPDVILEAMAAGGGA